jgi:Uri superfamily endonuclease
MRPDPGTYALIFQSHANARAQIGRWRGIGIMPGYYVYVGSAFGPGGVRARVSRHLRTDKPRHWHIDYLRDYVTPLAVWISYEPEHHEHGWAQILFDTLEMTPIQGFGCSDCKCHSHLFHTLTKPNIPWHSELNHLKTLELRF